MISSIFCAIFSVRSTCVPLGARKRRANWPVSVLGKISVPRNAAEDQMITPQTAR
jgi:hypothetical protein